MNEKHVTSLEISKELKKAGFSKETEFWWSMYWKEFKLYSNRPHKEFIGEYYPAPLATEILEELPEFLDLARQDDFTVSYGDGFFEDKSLPNALALMWIYLRKIDDHPQKPI